MKLEELKAKFLAEVNESHIGYDWDAGWCYSYINHPLVNTGDELLDAERRKCTSEEEYKLKLAEREEWEQYVNDWLYTHDGMLYHMSDVVGNKLVNQADTLEGEEAKEYAEGLISYIKKHFENDKMREVVSFYHLKMEELERFVAGLEFEEKVLQQE